MRSSPPSKNEAGKIFTCFDSFYFFFCKTTSMPADTHRIIHMRVSFHPFWVLTLWLWSGIKQEFPMHVAFRELWPPWTDCSVNNISKEAPYSEVVLRNQTQNQWDEPWNLNLPAEVTPPTTQDKTASLLQVWGISTYTSTAGSPYTPRVERNFAKSFSSFWERCPRVTCPL